jgi:hypothetical protein
LTVVDLATHQRRLLGLFRSTYRPSADDDAYIQRVAESKDLREARKNILMWRFYVLERTAALTVTLLQQRGLLTERLNAFIAQSNISPFRETQAPAFLEMMSAHPDPLVAAVAQFELAFLKVRAGDSGRHLVRWPVQPHSVLDCLARNQPLPTDLPAGPYQILVHRQLPGCFQILRIESLVPAGHQ